MPEYATVTYPEADSPDRRFERIIGKSAALEKDERDMAEVFDTVEPWAQRLAAISQ